MIVYFIRNINYIYGLIFIIGVLSVWRLYLGFIYGLEIVNESASNLSGSIFNLFDAQVIIFASLYLEHVSNDWMHLHSIYIGLTALSFSISLFLPESPKFVVQKKDYQKAFDAYNFIADFNGKPRLDREKERFIDERKADRRALKKQLKNIEKKLGGDLRHNLKASLAAPDPNVINEDDKDLESSSSEGDQSGKDMNLIVGPRKLSSSMNPRKVSDVKSDDY